MDLLINPNIDFLLYEKGETFLLNGVPQKGLFMEVTDKISFYDDIILTSKIPFETGNAISYQDSNWLVISQVQENDDEDISIYRARIRKCNYTIKFNFLGNVKPFPAILSTKALDVQSDKYLTLPVGKIIVSLQDNVDSRDIILAQRFLIMGQPWKVSGIDKSQIGLIILNCDYDSFTSSDDKVNEIANRWTYETVHTYILTIDNGISAMVNINNIITLNASVTDNGVAMTNPDITYLSSDSAIASVDNAGKVMGIGLGTANITAQMTNNPTVNDTLEITVQEAPVTHNYSITITGSATIKVNQSQSYVSHFYDNGIEVLDQSGTWTIASPNPDATTNIYATINSQTGNSASVKATSNTSYYQKYFNLICTMNSDNAITGTYQIQVKPLF